MFPTCVGTYSQHSLALLPRIRRRTRCLPVPPIRVLPRQIRSRSKIRLLSDPQIRWWNSHLPVSQVHRSETSVRRYRLRALEPWRTTPPSKSPSRRAIQPLTMWCLKCTKARLRQRRRVAPPNHRSTRPILNWRLSRHSRRRSPLFRKIKFRSGRRILSLIQPLARHSRNRSFQLLQIKLRSSNQARSRILN